MRKELLAAEQLEIGVFQPAIAQRLVGEIVHMLEDGETGHEPCGQRRTTGNVGVDGAEALFQKTPVDRADEHDQRVTHVDDLIEPRTKQIPLPAVSPLLRTHCESPCRPFVEGRESRLRRKINLQGNHRKWPASRRKR